LCKLIGNRVKKFCKPPFRRDKWQKKLLPAAGFESGKPDLLPGTGPVEKYLHLSEIRTGQGLVGKNIPSTLDYQPALVS
jgi:hypothetical protein